MRVSLIRDKITVISVVFSWKTSRRFDGVFNYTAILVTITAAEMLVTFFRHVTSYLALVFEKQPCAVTIHERWTD